MRTQYLSLLLGMTATATATMISAVPARAASLSCETGNIFDYSSIQFIKTRPLSSNNCLRLFGERLGATDPNPQGFVGYGFAHVEMSLNSPNNPAPYYAAGIDFSPENVPGAKQAATLLDDITGFGNFAKFLGENNITSDRIGFSFGAKDRDYTKTWNLGDDINGKNYFSSPTSTLEERTYSANPDEVESFLLLDGNKFITFGYGDIHSFLEYGATREPDDDTEAIISNPFKAFKVAGLNGLSDGLANAFLADVKGNKIQLVSEDAGVVPDSVFVSEQLGALNPVVSIRFPIQLRVVNVPEPSITIGFLGLGLLALRSRLKNKNRHRCYSRE